MEHEAGQSNTVRWGDRYYEETVRKWYDELDSESSDVDNEADKDFAIESGLIRPKSPGYTKHANLT
nr:unnamed protein product [Callosobruchus analis]